MSFELILTPEAQADIRSLSRSWQSHILDKLAWMGENATLIRHQALKGGFVGRMLQVPYSRLSDYLPA